MNSQEAGDRFERAWSKVCEFFPNAVLIVAVQDDSGRCLRWRSTDKIWSIGALEMYRELSINEERLEQADRLREGGE